MTTISFLFGIALIMFLYISHIAFLSLLKQDTNIINNLLCPIDINKIHCSLYIL